MTAPDETRLLAALEATWPPAAIDETSAPGWRLRDGAGAGKRVDSARSLGASDFEAAAAAMRAAGRRPLIQVASNPDLDAALDAAGWEIVDPTLLLAAPVAKLVDMEAPRGVKSVLVRTRLALLDEIWDAGGIGPARRALMDRCALPKATIMTRTDDIVGGLSYVAVDGDVAMIHAVEVRPEARRRGVARAGLSAAARFAAENGAQWLALAVTEANAPARALYHSAGMENVGRYHYRLAPEQGR